ncbi:hypothetical protein DFH11DRAFT_457707 [Phellopilus nigrolimitatus]|nr:hypothetical protein DFH11DRAFT_457707 [Phellopilus nigrolimitatus]
MASVARIPKLAFVGSACMSCGRSLCRLQRCSRCKRVSYCDDICQKLDYFDHKHFCRALSIVRVKEESVFSASMNLDRESLEDLVIGKCQWTINEIRMLTGGPLTKTEKYLVVYEPRCAVCLRSDHDLTHTSDAPSRESKELTRCLHCYSVFACCDAHRRIIEKTHRSQPFEPKSQLSQCIMLQCVAADDHAEMLLGEKPMPFWSPSRRFVKYARLPAAGGDTTAWKTWISHPKTQWPGVAPSFHGLRLLTVSLSLPLTILYGIELFDDDRCIFPLEHLPGPSTCIQTKLHSREHLEIHIVGAASNELMPNSFAAYEELLHSLPACTHLTLRLVGPGLELYRSAVRLPYETKFTASNCDECEAHGIVREHVIHPYLYHEWMHEHRRVLGAEWTAPDLVICFNASFCDTRVSEELWAPTVTLLAELGVPTLVTSNMDKEAKEDSDYVRNLGGLIAMEPHRNPWRNERGIPEFYGNNGFYFSNGHIFGFRGQAVD